MFCPQCRSELPDDAKYCIKCGYDFTKIKTPPEKKNYQDSLDVPGTLIQKESDIKSFEVGTLFANRYEILSEGHKGGMGVVYKCKDTKLNKIVALKIIHPRLLESEQALTRFRQEVSISQELQHANIVKVFNLEEWEGKEYFTMEWVEGITLREIINQRKKESRPFSMEEAYKIISQLSDALHHAHRYTIHRDIKPENILVTNDSELKVKLTDFGIAKMLTSTGLTSISMQMGTPYYMAPEQKTDAAHVDKRADIYALGIVLFELLTFENTIGFELPSEINKGLPPVIDNIVKKAVATKPNDRYAGAKDLAEALKNVTDRFSEQAEISRKEAEEQKRKEEEQRQREAEERKQKEAGQKNKEQEEEQHRAEQERIEEQKRWEEEQRRQTVETERTRITETSGQQKSFSFTNKALAAIAVLAIIIGIYVYKSKEEPSTGPEISYPPMKVPIPIGVAPVNQGNSSARIKLYEDAGRNWGQRLWNEGTKAGSINETFVVALINNDQLDFFYGGRAHRDSIKKGFISGYEDRSAEAVFGTHTTAGAKRMGFSLARIINTESFRQSWQNVLRRAIDPMIGLIYEGFKSEREAFTQGFVGAYSSIYSNAQNLLRADPSKYSYLGELPSPQAAMTDIYLQTFKVIGDELGYKLSHNLMGKSEAVHLLRQSRSALNEVQGENLNIIRKAFMLSYGSNAENVFRDLAREAGLT